MFRPSPLQKLPSLKLSQKFLVKQQSTHNFFIFPCCQDVNIDDYQSLSLTVPTYSPKISIKQLKRKRQGLPLEECSRSASKSKSKKTKASNKTSIQNIKKKYQKNIKTQPNQVSNTQKIQSIIPDNLHKQKPKEADNSIHNFHTTNYIVGQCIVQPEQTNLFVQKQRHQTKSSIQDQFNSIFDQKNDKNLMEQLNRFSYPIQDPEKLKKIEKRLRDKTIKQQLRPMVNFSFGQRQKNQVIGKYLNMLTAPMKQSNNHHQSQKSIKSHQLSRELYQIDSTIQEELRKMNEQQIEIFQRGTFQKRNSLNYLVTQVGRQVYKSQSQHSESKESMVIDTHKSIIERFQNQKQAHFF